MRKTCLIHIGTPKTGTSSLQATLFAARKELLKNNVNYFDFQENHNLLAPIFDITIDTSTSLMSPDFAEQQKVKPALLKAIKTNKSEVFIISGEALSMLTQEGAKNLKTFLHPHFDDFKVVAYVREPFGFASSAAQQLIKAGSFSDRFVEQTLIGSNPGWGNVLPLYRRRIENFLEVFGKKNTVIKDFTRPKLKNENIIDDFLFSIIDYQGDLKKIETINKNEALDGDLVRVLEQLNIVMPAMVDEKRNKERSPTLVMRLRNYSRDIEKKKYAPVELDQDKFLEVIEGDVDWLSEVGGVKFDLTKPVWEDEPINPRKMAEVINHFSLALDSEKGKQGKVKKSYSKLQKKFETLHEKYTALQASHAKSKDNFTVLHKKYTALQTSHAKSKDNYVSIHEKYKALQSDYKKSKDKYAPLHRKYTDLQGTFAKSKDNFTSLDKKYKELQAINKLQNQKLALLNQRILITKGKTEEAEYATFLEGIDQMPALKSAAMALTHEGCTEYVALIGARIQQIEISQSQAKKPQVKKTKNQQAKPKKTTSLKNNKSQSKAAATKKPSTSKTRVKKTTQKNKSTQAPSKNK